MGQGFSISIRSRCYESRKEQLNKRMIRFLNAYGIKDYGDDIMMNNVLLQMRIEEFHSDYAYNEFLSIARDFHELQRIGARVIRLARKRN